jgi:hypothetical protein
MYQRYEDWCELFCVDMDTTREADILNFREGSVLEVVVQQTMKIKLFWSLATKNYVGHAAGMEFTSYGPRETKL